MEFFFSFIYTLQKNRVNLQTLFLITGDHGMRDTGGHGGNSYGEVNVPLIILNGDCVASRFVTIFTICVSLL